MICLSSGSQPVFPLIDRARVGQDMTRVLGASRQDVPPPGKNQKGDNLARLSLLCQGKGNMQHEGESDLVNAEKEAPVFFHH